MRRLGHCIGWGLLGNLAGRPRPEVLSQVEASSFAGRVKCFVSWILYGMKVRNMELAARDERVDNAKISLR